MRGLGSGVDDDGGLEGFHRLQDGGAVAKIQLVVLEAGERLPQALLIPAGVPLRAEEPGAAPWRRVTMARFEAKITPPECPRP